MDQNAPTQPTNGTETSEALAHLYEAHGDSRVVNDAFHGADALTRLCHGLAAKSGWWNGVDRNDRNIRGTKIALMHSELSEALEGVRKDTLDGHLSHRTSEEVELGDAVIRIFDYAGARGLDLAGAIIEKLSYNQNRADHKPENREKDGGKKV